jgi:hypothetical protein
LFNTVKLLLIPKNVVKDQKILLNFVEYLLPQLICHKIWLNISSIGMVVREKGAF